MKKIIYISTLSILLCSCSFFEHKDLRQMEKAVLQHIKNNDKDKKIHTNVEHLQALSYEEIPKDERKQTDDYYLTKMYLKGKWSYLVGNRVYNMSDTIDCYFDKDKVFIRIETKSDE